jgi:hypothetical protein
VISTGDGLNLFIQLIGSAADTILVPNRIYMFEDFQRLASDHTAIFYDPRNRGLSDAVIDPSKLTRDSSRCGRYRSDPPTFRH